MDGTVISIELLQYNAYYIAIYTGWAKKVITSNVRDVITFLAHPVYIYDRFALLSHDKHTCC